MQIFMLQDKIKNQILADVIEFDDGQLIVKWRGGVASLVIHKSLDEFKTISVNESRELISKLNI